MRRLTLFFAFLLVTVYCRAQPSCGLRISVITCGMGDELYATFGHTAIRVVDSSRFTDIVYNYGTFNFDDPGFYTNFIMGRPRFSLSPEPMQQFMGLYQYEQRSVREQLLNLTCEDAHAIQQALDLNAREENRYYIYDYIHDNCTTRVRDLLYKYIRGFNIPRPIYPHKFTFRDGMHEYLNRGGKPWSRLGIDLCLGSPIDKPLGIKESLFLPEYLEKGIDSAIDASGRPLATRKLLLEGQDAPNRLPNWLPAAIFSLITIVLLFTKNRRVLNFTDSFLLYLTGLAGCLFVFLWAFTDHTASRWNYNLLWALPTHFVAALFVWRRPPAARTYFRITSIISVLVLVAWSFLPQQLNPALVPIVVLLAYRLHRLAQTPAGTNNG